MLSQGWGMREDGPIAVAIINDKDDDEIVEDVVR